MADRPTYQDLERKVGELERELAQRRASERELAIFRRLAEAAGYGFGMAGINGNITYANAALRVMLGEATPEALAYYFRQSLRYSLGDDEMTGLGRFHEYCVKHGVVPDGEAPSFIAR